MVNELRDRPNSRGILRRHGGSIMQYYLSPQVGYYNHMETTLKLIREFGVVLLGPETDTPRHSFNCLPWY